MIAISSLPATYAEPAEGASRALVVVNGEVFSPQSVEVSTNNYSSSDTASAVISLSGEWQNASNGARLSAIDFGAATESGKIYPIAIYIGYPSNPTPGSYAPKDLYLQFAGVVDTFDWEYGQDTVTLSCRSYAAMFLNTKITATWNNQTTTSVVQELAKQQGLSTSIDVPSPGLMQQVYAKDFVTGTQNMNEWALLQAMAQYDHVECFVRGTTLYYRQALSAKNAPRISLEWEKNLIGLTVRHSPQFSSLIKVNVKVWSPLHRTGVRSSYVAFGGQPLLGTQKTGVSTSTASPVFGTRTTQTSSTSSQSVDGLQIRGQSGASTSSTTGGSFASGYTTMPKAPSALEFTYHYPGLDRAAADAIARKLWIELSSHLFQMTAQFAVTKETQALMNQDTIFHLSAPVASHELDYNVRRIMQSWGIGQTAGGTSRGWTASVDGVNLPAMEQTI